MNHTNSTINLTAVARELEAQGPTAVLRWAIETYGDGLAVATGFGPEGIVNLRLVSQIDAAVHVFFIETGLLFPETYALRRQLQARLGLTITAVYPELDPAQQAAQYGPDLWRDNPDLCCFLRKVAPLRRHLAGKKAWVTGIRRDQTPARAGAQVVAWDEVNGLVKINPLANWTSAQVWEHIRQHDLPVNPLHRQGYPSIGCRPCTRAVRPGEDPRAGRWAGFVKTECGLHLNYEL